MKFTTERLQRKLERLSREDPEKFGRVGKALGFGGGSSDEIERWREKESGWFGNRLGHKWRWKMKVGWSDWRVDWLGDWAFDHNVHMNEGLAYVVDVAWREVADIAPWYTIIFTDNVTPAVGDTYASPGWTEADGNDLDETARQAWVDNSTPTGTTTRSISNSDSPVEYTGDQSFTAYGACQVGGGTAATTLADSAGGGTVQCGSAFASSKAMTLDLVLQVTYTKTVTDDGA